MISLLSQQLLPMWMTQIVIMGFYVALIGGYVYYCMGFGGKEWLIKHLMKSVDNDLVGVCD